jgi:stress response protein SCP2
MTYLETETYIDSTNSITNLETDTILVSTIPTTYLEIETNLESTIPTTYLEIETYLDSTNSITNFETDTNLDSNIPTTYLETKTYIDSTNLNSNIPTSYLEIEKNLDSTIPTTYLENEANLDSTIPTTYLETETYLDSTNSITNLETETYIESTQIPTTIKSNDNSNIEEKECLEHQCILINSNLINIYLKWDYGPSNIYDLDLWLEGLDKNNNLIEKVYFLNLSGFNGAVNLNKDNLRGYQFNNVTETISIKLNKIQNNIKSLIILINSYGKKDIINARNAYISIYEMKKILSFEYQYKLINKFWLNNAKSGIFFFMEL